MSELTEALLDLRTARVDSREGYEKALDLAEGKGLSPLFRDMIAMRTRHVAGLEPYLVPRDLPSGDGTSFMATVHRAVIGIRALFSELDDSILPGLIDGEKRIVADFDAAIAKAGKGMPEHSTLVDQRAALVETIGRMDAMARSAERVP